MRVILKPKQSNKTTRLIQESARTGFYMVVCDHKEAYRVSQLALDYGLSIPFPITFDDFIGFNGRYLGRGVKGLLIDNADMLLQRMAHAPVAAITLTDEGDTHAEQPNL